MTESARRATIGLVAWLTPVVVLAACVALDLSTSAEAVPAAFRPTRICLMAGLVQVIALLAIAPWWGATLDSALAAGLRVAVVSAGSGLLVGALMLLEAYGSAMTVLRVAAVVFGTGLVAAGLAAALGAIFRSRRGAPAFVTLLGFALAASPFWGAALISLAATAWKPAAFAFVMDSTPIAALADAARFDDLFYSRTLYNLLPVTDYAFFSVPAWWAWSLAAAAAGIVLLAVATLLRRRATRR